MCGWLVRVVAAERLTAQAQAEGRESLGWHTSRSTISDNAPSPTPRSEEHHHQVVTPCSRRQGEEMPASQSDSGKGDVYGVENLVGQGMFAMNSTQLNPDSSTGDRAAATSFQTQFTDHEPAKGGKSDVVDRRQSTSSVTSQTIPSQESECLEHRRISMTSSSQGLTFSPIAKGSPELDRDTTAMAYLLAGNRNLGQDTGDDEWSEDSSEVVIPGMSMRRDEAGNQENLVLGSLPSTTGTDNATHQQSLFSHRVRWLHSLTLSPFKCLCFSRKLPTIAALS